MGTALTLANPEEASGHLAAKGCCVLMEQGVAQHPDSLLTCPFKPPSDPLSSPLPALGTCH